MLHFIEVHAFVKLTQYLGQYDNEIQSQVPGEGVLGQRQQLLLRLGLAQLLQVAGDALRGRRGRGLRLVARFDVALPPSDVWEKIEKI